MKKKILAAAAAVLVMTGFTSCGSSKDTPEATPAETTPAAATASETASETASPQESTSEEVSSESTSSEASETGSADNGGEGVTVSGVESTNPLAEYINAAMAVDEWPYMVEVEDEMIIKDYFLLDRNNPNYKEFMAVQCAMSANMSEIILIRAEDTKSAADDLKERRKKAQDMDAFYPADVEKAEKSIVGTSGEFAYFILCSNPEAAEEALLLKIGQ